MFVYRQDTETTSPAPQSLSTLLQCSLPCKHLRSSSPRQGGSKMVQPSPLTTWSSAVLGALRVAPPRGAERRQKARRAAEGLAALISRSRSPRPSRAHPRARSYSHGLGRDRDPCRHFTSPLGAGRRSAGPSGVRRGRVLPARSGVPAEELRGPAAQTPPPPSVPRTQARQARPPARPPATKPAANSSLGKPNLPAGKQGLGSHLRTPATSCLLIG